MRLDGSVIETREEHPEKAIAQMWVMEVEERAADQRERGTIVALYADASSKRYASERAVR